MNIIIYSVNFGKYDKIWASDVWEQYPSYYVSDELRSPEDAQLILDPDITGDMKRQAGKVKILSHKMPEHDISLFVDASVAMVDMKPLIDDFIHSDADIAIPSHPVRDCTYKEATACAIRHLDNPDIIEAQMKQYRKEGLPEEYGMVATTIMLRKNNAKVKRFNNEWHSQLLKYSKRDQLSVMYTSWVTGITIDQIPVNIYKNRYFRKKKHAQHFNH